MEILEKAARAAQAVSSLRDPDAAERVARHAAIFSDKPLPSIAVRKRIEELAQYVDVLRGLLKAPGITQRTPEWYAARENMVTGSELESATSPASQRQFFLRKLGLEPRDYLKDTPAIRWGVKYEPVACRIYQRRTGARVHEFGLLAHKGIEGFGASPDGINDLGIMLEIKCPFTRGITGEIPRAYYAQVQAQLDTAGLRECDFLECKFVEYANAGEFLADSHPDDTSLTRGGLEKGAVSESGEVVFGIDAAEWAERRKGASLWRLVVYNRVRIVKDEGFFDAKKREEVRLAVQRIARYRADPAALDRDFPPKNSLPQYAFREA